jgi:hypothetical protein
MTPVLRRALVTVLLVSLAAAISQDAPTPAMRVAQAATETSSLGESGIRNIASTRAVPEADPEAIVVHAGVDYPAATWVPAAATNFTVANRPDDYPVDMIVIHDIEGSVSSAITAFQDPSRHGSAHYIVSYHGQFWQMVNEEDIAWHAGNWDYNTRSIGIEHEGYAYTPGVYTLAEYRGSAHIAASICSRWGVPMDRSHVIGHYQVPDPNHPGLYGGSDHHTDPGPYWNWSYYMWKAQAYAALLPSPPHMMVDPVAVPWDQSASVTWRPAHTCHEPIASYRVVLQPGNIVLNLPGSATTATIGGLQNGTRYSFTVTAINADGQSTLPSNSVIAGPHCATAGLTSTQASPQFLGTSLQLSASSTICPNPTYQFWLKYPNGQWDVARDFGGGSWTWNTALYPLGDYTIRVWANQSGDRTSPEAFTDIPFSLTEGPPCTSASISPTSVTAPGGFTVSFTASATGCPVPIYEYWVQYPNGNWYMRRTFSTNPTWNWNMSGLTPGKYTVHVWANHPGYPMKKLEQVASSTVTLTGCTSASLSPPTLSQPAGSTVSLTAGSGGCLNPRYEFWVLYPNGKWYVKQGWGGPTFNWNTAGLVPGTYTAHAWANQTGDSTARFEAMGSATVTLTGCTSATVSPSTGSSKVGTSITFTASSSGCPNPVYAFWLQWVNGTWHLMRGFSTTNTWTWNTSSGYSKGTYHIHAWANQQGANTGVYEVFGSSTRTLT